MIRLAGMNPIQILLDGLFVLNLDKGGILLIFVAVLGWGSWASRFLLDKKETDPRIRLPVTLGLGSLVLILLSFASVLLGRLWHPLLFVASVGISIFGAVFLFIAFRRKEWSARPFLIFCGSLFILLVIRLTFLKDMVLPPYDDSPEHYAIVQNFISSGQTTAFYSLENIFSHYYHFGFHALAAWLTIVSWMNPARSIPLLGQLFLVVLPVSVFLLGYTATADYRAGLGSACFAAFAWQMPAFAANWGKYPVITGIALFPALLGLWILWLTTHTRNRTSLFILITATVTLVFVHTRLTICLFIALAGYFLIGKILFKRRLKFWEILILAVVTSAGFLIFGNTLFAYYGDGYFIALVFVLLLLPFAFYAFPNFLPAIMFFVWGIWIASRVPTFIDSGGSTWLDQPFVETVLCVPLSLSAGMGLVSLLDQVKSPGMRRGIIGFSALVVAIGLSSSRVVYPDPCCDYVKAGDLQAIQWIEENTPRDAVIWIAGFRSRNYIVGMDAGVWIQTLTGRDINKLPYDFAWDAPDAPARICQPIQKNVYIYEGGRPYSFDDARLEEQNWLRRTFAADGTKIYWVAVCH